MLIAVNPYKNINGLYSDEKIKCYQTNNDENLPPHLFAIGELSINDVFINTHWNVILVAANRIIQRLERPQSIIFTGESGSGKTKSAAHLSTFLGSNKIKQSIAGANSIFELFGNAATSLNGNSSRFSKIIEVSSRVSLKFCNNVYAENCFADDIFNFFINTIFLIRWIFTQTERWLQSTFHTCFWKATEFIRETEMRQTFIFCIRCYMHQGNFTLTLLKILR